jgi:hypothetical protein
MEVFPRFRSFQVIRALFFHDGTSALAFHPNGLLFRPQTLQPLGEHNIMRHWFAFFLGTPRRFLATVGVLLGIFAAFRPDVVQQGVTNALNGLFGALTPFVQPALEIVVIGLAFWFFGRAFLSGSRPHKKKD